MNEPFTDQDYGLSLLSSMFHQDWRHAGNHVAILDIFLWPDQVPPAVLALRDDATMLGSLPSDDIEKLWTIVTDGNFVFDSEVGSGSEWMTFIVERCDRWLSDRQMRRPAETVSSRGAPSERSMAKLLNAIITSHANDDGLLLARSGLIKCSELGADSLALRLLVRAIDSRRLALSQEEYVQLTAMGKRLGCGEFVVSAIEYLVA